MPDADPTPVVTVFLRHRGEVLLLRRSDAVDSYPGRWGAVAGHVEDGDPAASALREVEEETGLRGADVHPRRQGSAFTVEDDDHGAHWRVHPFLFDVDSRSIQTNWETEAVEWASPTVLLRRDTVPDLWTSYRRVAPSILGLTNDTTHGSAYLSIRALEVLRDRAGMLAHSEAATIEDARGRLIGTAHRLLDARPSMAALANRLHRAMHASLPELPPDAVETNAHEAIQNALAADAAAAETAATQLSGTHVLTLSRSGTVLSALQAADPSPTVSVAVSAPGDEGVAVAERLTEAGLDVTLLPDAAVARRLQGGSVDAVLVGADTVQPSGAVVNKAGTYGAALAAHRADVPVYAACAVDKIAVDDGASDESAADRAVYDGSRDVEVWAPRFDTTPAALVTGGLLTDRGRLAADAIDTVTEELTELRAWT
ncbi:NUDIX domain-containing protein [Salinibacter ruber]|nr:NUDIX domain-containing protein [Salinibacter ruber]MCS4049456.1 translation initiation factor 2B subunit (eIF-2B alpha/beta/delta family)/8-oxo-dGTP pyrophosphatase MutT (NUDIX family) [Salinibacter ruber]